jgi:predicted dehydrogenase
MLCKQVVRIEAEKGTVEVEHVFLGEHAGPTIRLLRADEDKIRSVTVPPEYLGRSAPGDLLGVYKTEPVGALGFVRAIRENRRPEPGFDVGVKVQEVVDAAIVSDRERRWIDLS